MIKYLIMAAALLISVPVQAAPGDSLCPQVESLARTIMSARQSGVSMSTMMNFPPTGEKAIDDMAKTLVREAFEEPRWQTPENKRIAIEDFAAKIAAICYSTDA